MSSHKQHPIFLGQCSGGFFLLRRVVYTGFMLDRFVTDGGVDDLDSLSWCNGLTRVLFPDDKLQNHWFDLVHQIILRVLRVDEKFLTTDTSLDKL